MFLGILEVLHCVTVFLGILEALNSVTVFLGILEVLHCVLVESPEALNLIKEGHIKSIISLLDKHGRNHKVDSTQIPLHYQAGWIACIKCKAHVNTYSPCKHI